MHVNHESHESYEWETDLEPICAELVVINASDNDSIIHGGFRLYSLDSCDSWLNPL